MKKYLYITLFLVLAIILTLIMTGRTPNEERICQLIQKAT